MTSSVQPEAASIRRQLRAVLGASWLVALAVFVFAGVAYVRAARQPDVYAGKAVVRVFNATAPAVGSGGAARVDPLREVQTQASYMTSEAVHADVRDRLRRRFDRIQAVRVSTLADSDLIQVAVESRSPAIAQEGAQAYAEVYVENRRESIAQTLGSRAEELRAQAAKLQEEISSVEGRIAELVPPVQIDRTGRAIVIPDSEEVKSLRARRGSLVDRLTSANNVAEELSAEMAIRQASIEVVDPAQEPRSPVRPIPLRDAAVGGALGLFLGVAVALLRERTNDRLLTVDDVEEAARPRPVLALIPVDKDTERASRRATSHRGPPSAAPYPVVGSDPTAPVAEAYRTLRAALLFSHGEEGTRSILVTSSVAGEGKTTTAANLAMTLARSGSKVLLADADLRRPTIHRVFTLDNEKGLTTVLLGQVPAADAPVPIDVPGPGTLDVLVAGPHGWEATEVLASGTAGPWLDELCGPYDYVVLDSAPVLSGADPLALARLSDAVLLVVRMGTRLRDVVMAQHRVEQVSDSLIGVVANAVSPSHAGYYYYDQRSRRSPGPRTRPPAPAPPPADVSAAPPVEAAAEAPVDAPVEPSVDPAAEEPVGVAAEEPVGVAAEEPVEVPAERRVEVPTGGPVAVAAEPLAEAPPAITWAPGEGLARAPARTPAQAAATPATVGAPAKVSAAPRGAAASARPQRRSGAPSFRTLADRLLGGRLSRSGFGRHRPRPPFALSRRRGRPPKFGRPRHRRSGRRALSEIRKILP
ncbi:MAG TPA: polysaccharide biosynthesis tyrosine autokinase [Acidimicrobiales bacterium]|nr:polysaccharide biosynthesis tyrosine autokinase [Acidimicrobiales bacterium]